MAYITRLVEVWEVLEYYADIIVILSNAATFWLSFVFGLTNHETNVSFRPYYVRSLYLRYFRKRIAHCITISWVKHEYVTE